MAHYWVYMHTNLIDGKMYVGITTMNCPEFRWGKRGSRYQHKNAYFWNAIQRYGWDNFSHDVWEVDSEEAMKQCEKDMIAFFNTKAPNGYNFTGGGDGCFDPSDALRSVLSISHKGIVSSTETKKKQSNSLKQHFIDHPEAHELASTVMRQRYIDHPEMKEVLSNIMKGKHPSAKTRAKLSASMKGKPKSAEHRANISKHQKDKHLAYGPDGKVHYYTQEEIDEQGLSRAPSPCKGKSNKNKGKKQFIGPDGKRHTYTLDEARELGLI